MIKIGVTGTRSGMNDVQRDNVKNYLTYKIYNDDFGQLHHGDCIGADDSLHCSITAAAETLGVSSATIRNWVKLGHLIAASERPLLIQKSSLHVLDREIRSGKTSRLKSRANKTVSTNAIIPNEYVRKPRSLQTVDLVADWFQKHKPSLDIDAAMFLVTLRWAECSGELTRDKQDSQLMSSSVAWKRQIVKRELVDWHDKVDNGKLLNGYQELSHIHIDVGGEDILGLVYQILTDEGEKSKKGMYYTPYEIIEKSISYENNRIHNFLDPCCGTGQYLVSAARILGVSLSNIIGFDIDKIAVRIARLNLLAFFSNAEEAPNVSCLDSITELATEEVFCETNNLLNSIDFIATNPPWGAYKNKRLPSSVIGEIESAESFALILSKAVKLLKEGGRLSFLLPEAFLNIKTHRGIRKVVLRETEVLRVAHLGRQFSGVFTPVILLDLRKSKKRSNSVVMIENNNKIYHVEQKKFQGNRNCVFDINSDEFNDQVISKIYKCSHVTLKNNAEWALGIVTGDNKRFVSSEKTKNMEAVYRGKDIQRFSVEPASEFIEFLPDEFQQVANLKFYRAPEKLLYRFISKTIIFSYDDRQRLTLNSANILIPKFSEFNIKVALGFLNSSVFQYIFTHKIAALKVLRGDLETLPFPLASKADYHAIEKLVNTILSNLENERDQIRASELEKKLDRKVYQIFMLTDNEINHIENSLK